MQTQCGALLSILMVGLASSVACDRIAPRSSNKPEERFELKQDNEGRLIRLDKTTGDLTIVDGTRLIPAGRSDVKSTSSPSSQNGPPDSKFDARTARPIPTPSTHAEVVSSSSVDIITITANAPVFSLLDRKAQPLVIAAIGSMFRVTGEVSDSYRIEFSDPELGLQTGFIEKRFATPTPSNAMQPVDVSMPDYRRMSQGPLDVSIQETTVNGTAPVDVSVTTREGR